MKIETGVKRTDERGIKENIIVECYRASYPYDHVVFKVIGQPINKDCAAYREIKSKLGDDWDTDLTDNWFMPGVFEGKDLEKISKIVNVLR